MAITTQCSRIGIAETGNNKPEVNEMHRQPKHKGITIAPLGVAALLISALKLLFVSMILTAPGIVAAAVPHVFSPGNPVLSSEVNANNDNLDSRVTALEGTQAVFPNFSGYAVKFSADGSLKNVVVLARDLGGGATQYRVRSRYASSTEQVSIDSVMTSRPYFAHFASVQTDSGNNITSISNRIETPDTLNYVDSNIEYSSYDPTTAAKTVTDDTTRELWGLCNGAGSASLCLAQVVNSIDDSFNSAYDWSRIQTTTGPFTVNGMTFNDVRLESYTGTSRTFRIRAKGVGMVFNESSDGTDELLIYYRADGVTGGSLAGTPFDAGQLLDGLFF
jgi:hypothetical protein